MAVVTEPEEQGLRCCLCDDDDQQLGSYVLLVRYPPGPGPAGLHLSSVTDTAIEFHIHP